MTLEYEGLRIRRRRDRPGRARARRARHARPGAARHQDAGHGRHGGARRLRSMNETLPVVMISGHGTIEHRGRSDQERRVRLHREAVRQRARARDLRNALDRRGCATRTGRSNGRRSPPPDDRRQPALQQVMAQCARGAPTNATVLIQGERRGQGARRATIHRNSLRSRERFVQVNCAAIPEELIESSCSATRRDRSPARPRSRSASSSRRTRHDLPRRSRRHEREGPRPRSCGVCRRARSSAWVGADDQGGRRSHRRDQQKPRRGNRERDLPRRSLFPPRGHPMTVPPLRERAEDIPPLAALNGVLRPREQRPAEAHQPGGARLRCSATAGRATSASCGTPSSG